MTEREVQSHCNLCHCEFDSLWFIDEEPFKECENCGSLNEVIGD